MTARARPAWTREGIVLAGNWEPLLFRRRSGLAGAEEAALYEREHAAETVEKLAELGVTLAMIHFDKGAGLAEEAEEIRRAKELADLCHRRGIRVGAYIRYDTIAWETLYLERPDLGNDHAVAWDGTAPVYANQPFRYFNCPNSDDWHRYLDERVRIAIQAVGADLIHFDGFSTGSEGSTCACDRCRDAFTRHLMEKYGDDPDRARERFGHARLDRIGLPMYHPVFRPLSGVDRVRDPALVEWIEHRCNLTARIHHRLASYVASLNPEVSVEVNALVHVHLNARYYLGVDLESFALANDFLWTEEPHDPRVLPSGVVVTRAREFKTGQALDNGIFSYIWGTSERQVKRSLGQAMTFSRHVIGHVGAGTPHEQPFWEIKRDWIAWWKANRRLFFGPASAAEVAVWRSAASLAHHCSLPYRSAVLVEQSLLQGHIPFDLVFDADVQRGLRHRVLVLPNVESISDDQAALVEKHVRAGGGLLITEESGHFDELSRQRPDTILREILGPNALSPRMYGSLGNWPHTDPLKLTPDQLAAARVRRTVGDGRAAYVPSLDPGPAERESGGFAKDARGRIVFPHQSWSTPANHAELLEAVRWVVGDRLSIELNAPPTVLCEHTRSESLDVIHLLNLADSPAGGTGLSVSVRPDHARARAKFMSPEQDEQELAVDIDGGRASINVPALDVYGVVAIELS